MKKKLTTRVLANGGHRVHRGFGDDFDGDGDVNVPQAHGLVVRRGEEAAVLIDESDGVDLSLFVVLISFCCRPRDGGERKLTGPKC